MSRTAARRPAAALCAVAAALALTLTSAPSVSAESNGGLRVMPLGDSITDGFNVPGGYRTTLWQHAAADHRVDDFVGSQFNGPPELGDHDHEGHSGWRIEQIDAQATDWVQSTRPRTVLLHIGTNDVVQDFDLGQAPARLGALIDRITTAAPDADVFVSDIIVLGDAGLQAKADAYNAAVPGVVDQYAQAGRHVHFVRMSDALTPADLTDGIHPTAGGYAKMADRWYAALTAGPWI